MLYLVARKPFIVAQESRELLQHVGQHLEVPWFHLVLMTHR